MQFSRTPTVIGVDGYTTDTVYYGYGYSVKYRTALGLCVGGQQRGIVAESGSIDGIRGPVITTSTTSNYQ